MKHCKRLLCMFLICAIALSLSGCVIIPVDQYYDDIETEKVASVDIYDFRGKPADFKLPDDASPVYTLQEDQQEDFGDDLGKIEFTDYIIITLAAVDPSFTLGKWVVRINYEDGGYALLGDGGYNVTYNLENKKKSSNHYSCDSEEWEQFLFKYLPDEFEAIPSEEKDNTTQEK